MLPAETNTLDQKRHMPHSAQTVSQLCWKRNLPQRQTSSYNLMAILSGPRILVADKLLAHDDSLSRMKLLAYDSHPQDCLPLANRDRTALCSALLSICS